MTAGHGERRIREHHACSGVGHRPARGDRRVHRLGSGQRLSNSGLSISRQAFSCLLSIKPDLLTEGIKAGELLLTP